MEKALKIFGSKKGKIYVAFMAGMGHYWLARRQYVGQNPQWFYQSPYDSVTDFIEGHTNCARS